MLAMVLVALFPGAFLRGELLSSADVLYIMEPWSKQAPEGFDRPKNELMVDPVAAFRPYYITTRAAWEAGEWPLWNPYQYLGVPLLANCQSAVFYPPQLLHALMDVDSAMSWTILLKLWLCGMSAFVCGRGVGLSRIAATYFSFGWMLGGYNWVWAYWPLPDVAVWMPVVFLAVEWIRKGEYRSGAFLLAFGGTLLLFAGHPETSFTMALGVGYYYVVRLALEWPGLRTMGRQFGALAAGWAIAVAVTLPMTLPFLEYLPNSWTFFERHGGKIASPVDSDALPTLFVPRFCGTHAEGNHISDHDTNRYFMLFTGLVTWMLLSAGLAGAWRDRNRRVEAIALIVPAVFGMFLAYGAWPLGFLNRVQPFASLIPTYNAVLFAFAWPLLAARGLDYMRENRLPWRGLLLPAAIVAGACTLIWLFYSISFRLYTAAGMVDYLHLQLRIAALFAVPAVLLVAVAAFRPLRRIGALAAVALLIVELAVAGRGLNPTLPRERIYPDTELFDYLNALPKPNRIEFTFAGIPSGIGTTYGLEERHGYDGLFPGRIVEFQSRLGDDIWLAMQPALAMTHFLENDRFGAIAPDEQRAFWEPVAAFEGIHIYRDPRSLPRAMIVPAAEVISDLDAMYARMLDSSFRPEELALLEAPLEAMPAGGRGEARVLSRTTTSMTIEAETDAPALLVVSEAWYPGWKAEVSGAPAGIVPVDRVLRGIPLPEGKHIVTMRYEPWTFTAGIVAAYAVMAATWVYAFFYFRGWRRQAGTAPPEGESS